jgi:hypothetical protein
MDTSVNRLNNKEDIENMRLYKLAADNGDAVGQRKLGWFYETGRGGLPEDNRLMLRVHPDKGGTNFFAKQLNLARDTLLRPMRKPL